MNDQNTPSKTFSIYTLSCPNTGAVRYVGATINVKERIRCHIKDAKKYKSSLVHRWIISLLDEGLMPIIEVVDNGDAGTWQEKEKYWIQRLLDEGCALTNSTDGGIHYKFFRRIFELQDDDNGCWHGVIGENHSNYGAYHSKESRLKRSELCLTKRPVCQYTKDGVFIRNWDSAKQASKELGISQPHITKCCQHKAKSAYNCIWRYADDPL